jgi:hypothetical protein
MYRKPHGERRDRLNSTSLPCPAAPAGRTFPASQNYTEFPLRTGGVHPLGNGCIRVIVALKLPRTPSAEDPESGMPRLSKPGWDPLPTLPPWPARTASSPGGQASSAHLAFPPSTDPHPLSPPPPGSVLSSAQLPEPGGGGEVFGQSALPARHVRGGANRLLAWRRGQGRGAGMSPMGAARDPRPRCSLERTTGRELRRVRILLPCSRPRVSPERESIHAGQMTGCTTGNLAHESLDRCDILEKTKASAALQI